MDRPARIVAGEGKDMTPEEVRQIFVYTDGKLLWNIETAKTKKGTVAGSNSHGYIEIKYKQKRYLAHRLIWCYAHGKWPSGMIDHIDGNKSNNRIENLRDVSNAVNQQNHQSIRSDNKTGVRGVVYRQSTNRYLVQIRMFGKNKYIGSYKTIEEATAARKQAEFLRSRT